jgi:succinoglycan biosynthesis protein ExoM
MEVCIGICTYKRPEIKFTLESIAAQILPKNVTIKIIVADNDETDCAKEYIEHLGCKYNIDLMYVHAPKRNISIARNACLDNATSSIFMFMDDDQITTPCWVALMLSKMESDSAQIVFGPVNSIYKANTPKWIVENDFHSTTPVFVDGIIKTGYTGNSLIDLNFINNLRFDLAYGKSGGEDTDFFDKLFRSGAKLSYEPNAEAIEPVSDHRLKISWLIKRQFRTGQSHAQISIDSLNMLNRISYYLTSFSKFIVCFFTGFIFILNPIKCSFWIMRGFFHLGVNLRLLGVKQIENY